MYKWPSDLSPAEFNGLAVDAVTFTVNTIVVRLDRDCFFTVESGARLKMQGEEEKIMVPPEKSSLMRLLGRLITSSGIDSDGASLILDLDDGFQLRLNGDDSEYECFHVNLRGREFTV